MCVLSLVSRGVLPRPASLPELRCQPITAVNPLAWSIPPHIPCSQLPYHTAYPLLTYPMCTIHTPTTTHTHSPTHSFMYIHIIIITSHVPRGGEGGEGEGCP